MQTNKLKKCNVNNLRDPIKILNHKERLQLKDKIATKVDPAFERINIKRIMLDEFNDILPTISNNLNMTVAQLKSELEYIGGNTNLEIHMIDKCNLKCPYCSFKRAIGQLTYHQIQLAIQSFKPKAITFSGGGENTLHPKFNEIIDNISNDYSDVQLGLISNGMIEIPSEIINKFSWVRISLDTGDAAHFQKLKKVDAYNKVLNTISNYLDLSDVENIGVGFLFSSDNIDYVPQFIEEMYKIAVKSKYGSYLNIQFRPLRPEYETFYQTLNGQNTGFRLITKEKMKNVLYKIEKLKASSDVKSFLENQSNYKILNTEELESYWMPLMRFNQCEYSRIYTLLRANGNLFSCIHLGEIEGMALGNISLLESKNGLAFIGLKRLYFSRPIYKLCDERNCRYSYINNIAARKDDKTLIIPPELQENFFF